MPFLTTVAVQTPDEQVGFGSFNSEKSMLSYLILVRHMPLIPGRLKKQVDL